MEKIVLNTLPVVDQWVVATYLALKLVSSDKLLEFKFYKQR